MASSSANGAEGHDDDVASLLGPPGSIVNTARLVSACDAARGALRDYNAGYQAALASVRDHYQKPDGPFMFWSGHRGWKAYSPEDQLLLEKYYAETEQSVLRRPNEVKLAPWPEADKNGKVWHCTVVLGRLYEDPDGHSDIVGYQYNQCDGDEPSRVRWVRKEGANNRDCPVLAGLQKCDTDCRPPGKRTTP